VRLHRKTYKIHTGQPAEEEAGEEAYLEPLSINKDGVLLIGKKKLKASVVATEKGTNTWILSRRAKHATFAGGTHAVYAGGTVMSQSGCVDFADLASLKWGGNMDITAIAVEREFREEAPGYELVSDTLQSVESRTTSHDHVRFFRASAQEVSSPARIETVPPELQETTGVFLLDVPAFIEKYHLDLSNFSAEEHRIAVKQWILEEAKIAGLTQGQRDDYFSSYNVERMIDDIGETIKTLSKEKVAWKYIPPALRSS
jgi:hypothetical protein